MGTDRFECYINAAKSALKGDSSASPDSAKMSLQSSKRRKQNTQAESAENTPPLQDNSSRYAVSDTGVKPVGKRGGSSNTPMQNVWADYQQKANRGRMYSLYRNPRRPNQHSYRGSSRFFQPSNYNRRGGSRYQNYLPDFMPDQQQDGYDWSGANDGAFE